MVKALLILVVLLLITVLLDSCTLPESLDVENATVSVTFATPGGAAHVLLACPQVSGVVSEAASPTHRSGQSRSYRSAP